MTDNLMVYMVTQEKMGSPEAEVTYFASITYHLQKKTTKKKQSIALYHSHFVSSLSGKEWCVTRQNVCMAVQLPMNSTTYCVVTKGASPQRS